MIDISRKDFFTGCALIALIQCDAMQEETAYNFQESGELTLVEADVERVASLAMRAILIGGALDKARTQEDGSATEQPSTD